MKVLDGGSNSSNNPGKDGMPNYVQGRQASKIMNDKELDMLLSNGKVYSQKMSVRAVKLTGPVKFEANDGSIIVAEPGDYLMQNTMGEKLTWAIPAIYFEANYREHGQFGK